MRREIAFTAGWKSYAQQKLARTALSSPELVRKFLQHVSAHSILSYGLLKPFLHVRCVVAPIDELDAKTVISKWPSKLNGYSADPKDFIVDASDLHWLLGRHKAVSAGLGGDEMSKNFPTKCEKKNCIPKKSKILNSIS